MSNNELTLAVAAMAFMQQTNQDMVEAAEAARVTRRTRLVRRKIRKLCPRSLNPTPRGQRRPPGTGRKQSRGISKIDDTTDFFYETGVSAEIFQQLYDLLLPSLCDPRITADGPKKRAVTGAWSPMTCLFITLKWLRHHQGLRMIAKEFGASAATVSRLLWSVIPKLYIALRDVIFMPSQEEIAKLPKILTATGAIDCTSHIRNRVHPWSTEYYRGDKHEHFITAQLVCGLDGTMWDVQLAPGHNNDQGMLNHTEMARIILDHETHLLADMGYTSEAVIRPDDVSGALRSRHASFRSVVEQNFALVHMFAAAGGKF